MLYLLDANVLIRAHADYYGIDQVPQFWEWLLKTAAIGHVKMPFEIHQEIAISSDPLGKWISETEVKNVLILDEEADQDVVNHVLEQGYGKNLTDSDLEKIGQDPFLIAYGLQQKDRIVVTKEVSAPSRTRANRKIPDVCHDLGVGWLKDFDFFKIAGFKAK